MSRVLYRAAVFFLMMPHLAERSIREKVAGESGRGAFYILAGDQAAERTNLGDASGTSATDSLRSCALSAGPAFLRKHD